MTEQYVVSSLSRGFAYIAFGYNAAGLVWDVIARDWDRAGRDTFVVAFAALLCLAAYVIDSYWRSMKAIHEQRLDELIAKKKFAELMLERFTKMEGAMGFGFHNSDDDSLRH